MSLWVCVYVRVCALVCAYHTSLRVCVCLTCVCLTCVHVWLAFLCAMCVSMNACVYMCAMGGGDKEGLKGETGSVD